MAKLRGIWSHWTKLVRLFHQKLMLGCLQLNGRADECPEEVKAEQGHPAEHHDAGEVQAVADDFARCGRYDDEKFARFGVLVKNKDVQSNVVDDDKKHGRENDGHDVGADDVALQVQNVNQTSALLFIEDGITFIKTKP